jgi:hypothetical protein
MPVTTMSGATLTVEAALSASTGSYGAWNSGLWDAATWGPDQIWTDISPYVRKVSTTRKFDRNIGTWTAGTASIELLNMDGRFSRSNLSGPYVTAGVTGIRAWRPVRVRATYGGVTYDVYRGYATAWKDTYVEASAGGGGAYTTMTCTDELGSLARYTGIAQTPAGAGETSGQRIQRILSAAGHTGSRNVALGNVTVQATDLSGNAVSALLLTTDSEGGGLFISRDGTVVYEHNYALIENTRSNTVQAVYGDGGGVELPVNDVEELANEGDNLVNIAQFTRIGGTVQTATDATSRALYGDKQASRTDLICETDAQVANLAGFYVQQLAQPQDGVGSIVITPRTNPAVLFPAVLGREVRDLVQVYRRPPGGYVINQLSHLAGISHVITADDWRTTFDLWSASVFLGVGRWDVATWDTSTWFF